MKTIDPTNSKKPKSTHQNVDLATLNQDGKSTTKRSQFTKTKIILYLSTLSLFFGEIVNGIISPSLSLMLPMLSSQMNVDEDSLIYVFVVQKAGRLSANVFTFLFGVVVDSRSFFCWKRKSILVRLMRKISFSQNIVVSICRFVQVFLFLFLYFNRSFVAFNLLFFVDGVLCSIMYSAKCQTCKAWECSEKKKYVVHGLNLFWSAGSSIFPFVFAQIVIHVKTNEVLLVSYMIIWVSLIMSALSLVLIPSPQIAKEPAVKMTGKKFHRKSYKIRRWEIIVLEYLILFFIGAFRVIYGGYPYDSLVYIFGVQHFSNFVNPDTLVYLTLGYFLAFFIGRIINTVVAPRCNEFLICLFCVTVSFCVLVLMANFHGLMMTLIGTVFLGFHFSPLSASTFNLTEYFEIEMNNSKTSIISVIESFSFGISLLITFLWHYYHNVLFISGGIIMFMCILSLVAMWVLGYLKKRAERKFRDTQKIDNSLNVKLLDMNIREEEENELVEDREKIEEQKLFSLE